MRKVFEPSVYVYKDDIAPEQYEALKELALASDATIEEVDGGDGVVQFLVTLPVHFSAEELAGLIEKMAGLGIDSTVMVGIRDDAPEDPYVIIHYKNAPEAVMKRIGALINFIESRVDNSVVGSVLDLPGDRPEDGLEIRFENEEASE